MKQTLLIAVLLFFAAVAGAQTKRQTKRIIEGLENEKWEIILPIEERMPKNTRSLKAAESPTNWGVNLVLPDDVKNRLAAECTHRVVLKILDTGGKQTHTYLQQGQLTGANYTNTPTNDDIQGHGTHVAGIAVANDFGLLDALVDKGLVTWKPVKVLNDQGSGMFSWIATAIDKESGEDQNYLSGGVSVVYSGSLSGGTSKVTALEAAMKTATESGILLFFAAGNTGAVGVQYPGNSPYTIAVGSVDKALKKSSFSSMGPEVHGVMPGSAINSTWTGNQFATLSGTSMATPFFSAAACIALSKWGRILRDGSTMRRYLAWCSTDLDAVGKDDNTGWGVVYIRSILDKDPVNMPPVIVPGEPPADTIFREVRTLNFTMPDKYTFIWTKGVPKGKMLVPVNGSPFKFDKKKDFSAMAGGKEQTLYITRLEIAVKTNLEAGLVYRQTVKTVEKYFKNRGLILGERNDYADATYKIGYWLDNTFWVENKMDVDVILIDGRDKDGNQVFFDRINGLTFKPGGPVINPPK